MVTVIIPTLNEENTIASVVNFAMAQPNVKEVIVVDDKSIDNTVKIAKENGAKVITSTKIGKGASMKDGVLCADYEIIVFLDGDIDPYPNYTIQLLIEPILAGYAGFVKSAFKECNGRVTELVAKPLLSIFFPELLQFNQPLSGMIAGKKTYFKELDFRDDYGVDVGILIDMHLQGVQMKQVDIGYIENKHKPWQELGKMSKEVAQAIIYKAATSKNPHYNFEEFGALNEIRAQMEYVIDNEIKDLNKIILFDLDTLLCDQFIDQFAFKNDLIKELGKIRNTEKDLITLHKRVALLLKDKSINELIEIVDNICIVEGTLGVIGELKRRGYMVGIISDDYDCIANHIKIKLGMDFYLSNELEFSKSICTGEIKIPSFFFRGPDSLCKHAFCKTNALLSLLEKYNIRRENCIYIGKNKTDLCTVNEAGLSIAFCSEDKLMNKYADVVISNSSFNELLHLAK